MNGVLFRILTPDNARKPFCAGIECRYEDGVVVNAAPIIFKRFIGRRYDQVVAICIERGWTIERVASLQE